MKVIVAVILAIGSVSAVGSGPYPPSGWRPQGSAFFLPGELQNPAETPLKETIVFENEAAGSVSLQEYGPPMVQKVSHDVINQDLPDVVTEQTFLFVEDKGAVSATVVEESLVSEGNNEQKSEIVQEVTTEAQFAEVKATETITRIADIELEADLTTASYAEAEAIRSEEVQATEAAVIKSEEVQVTEAEVIKSEEVQATLATVEEKLEKVVVEEVETVETGVKNIAETLINLENEIKAEQVQSVEATAEVKVNQEGPVPEGFLEYGPPGFREYGPPKGDELLRTAVVAEEPSNALSLANNESRRRRFSPKFRTQNIKRIH